MRSLFQFSWIFDGEGPGDTEKPAETLRLASASLLASNLVRAPNSRSGGHEFESPVSQELGALTKRGKTLGTGLSTGAIFHGQQLQ
jgi:hypothetical protein